MPRKRQYLGKSGICQRCGFFAAAVRATRSHHKSREIEEDFILFWEAFLSIASPPIFKQQIHPQLE
jgi:hypothetical protein